MKKPALYLLLASLVFLPLVSACSSSADDTKAQAEKDEKTQAEKDERKTQEAKAALEKKKPLPICPHVAIVRGLDYFGDFGGEKMEPAQLVSESRMENIQGDCAYKDNGIDINFDVDFLAARGPRLGGDHGSFPFFIAVMDPDENILTKDQMTEEFTFSDEKKIIGKTEHLHVFLPLAKDKKDTGPSYQVFLGYQLTQQQEDLLKARAEEAQKASADKADKAGKAPE